MICDRYGLPLTTTSDRAAAYYVDGVDRMLAARSEVVVSGRP